MDKNMQLFEQNNNSRKVKCQKCRRYIGMCMYLRTRTHASFAYHFLKKKKEPKEEDGQKKMCPPAVPIKREKYTLSRAYSTCVSV